MQPAEQPNQVGKRCLCGVCGSEFIVTKAGTNQLRPLMCHDEVMALK